MPSSSTITSFFSFTSDTVISSSQMNSNFQTFRGNIVPVETDTAAASHLEHNLGASDHAWESLFAQNLKIYDQSTSPSAPPSGFTGLFTKADKLYTINDGGGVSEVGSGAGGINYITNDDAETDTTGWDTYADSGSRPVDATGGAANITWTRSTSSPLRGTASFLLTKGGSASRQGEGVKNDFTIDSADQAKMLSISFDYEIVSGTYSPGTSSTDSDLICYIYDRTNAANIEPISFKLDGAVIGNKYKASCVFQSAYNSTSYRLVLHVATTSASDYSIRFDNVQVGPQAQTAVGAIITEWASFTPTGSWSSNTTYSGRYRRVGDLAEISVNVALTGAPTAASLTVNLPSGLVIDTAKLPSTTDMILGVGEIRDSGTTNFEVNVFYSSTTAVSVLVGDVATYQRISNAVSNTVPMTFANGDNVNIIFQVPISGWGSVATLGQDADTRIVSMRATASSVAVVPNSATDFVFGTVVKDTHGTYASGTGIYTCPVGGDYLVKAKIPVNGAVINAFNLGIQRNSSDFSLFEMPQMVAASFTSHVEHAALVTNCVAGDTLKVRFHESVNGASFLGTQELQIFKLSGPAQVAASERVVARYSTNASQSIPSQTSPSTIIDYEDVGIDTHSAVTIGSSWKFTAPRNDHYQVNAAALFNSGGGWAAGEFVEFYINKNGTAVSGVVNYQVATHAQFVQNQISDIVQCNAGDTIDIRIVQNSGGALTLQATASFSFVSISSIGGGS